MKKENLLLILIIFHLVLIPNLLNNSFAEENICEWENITVDKSKFKEFSEKDDVFAIQCDLGNQNIQNKIIMIYFKFISNEDYDWNLIINTPDGFSATSLPIMDWYDISKNEAHIAIDVNDFDFNNISKEISNFQIVTNNPNGIEIFKTELIDVSPFENYEIWENIPIQNPLIALTAIFVISFPLGYIVIEKFQILPQRNFFFSFPWFISIGLEISLIILFLISIVLISFEIVIGFLIFEYLFLFYFIYKNKIKKIHFDKTSLFFLLVFCGILILPVVFSQLIGWPVSVGDAKNHMFFTINIIENQSIIGSRIPLLDGLPPEEHLPNYPVGIHTMMAGISILTNSYPATTMFAFSIFVKILVPMLLISVVYWLTRSYVFSSLIFLASFLNLSIGDYVSPHVGSDVGFIFVFSSLISFFNLGSEEKRKFASILLIICGVALSIVYYPFTPLIIILLAVLLRNYIKNNKIFVSFSAFFVILFGSVLVFGKTILENIGFSNLMPYTHSKYVELPMFNFGNIESIFLISSITGFLISIYLIFDKKFRIISTIYIVVFLIHILSFSEEIVRDYLFFYKALRSYEIMIMMSYMIILFGCYKLFQNKNIQKLINKLPLFKIQTLKILVVIIGVIVLIPSFFVYFDEIDEAPNKLWKIPGGNEKLIYEWLLENTEKQDLILNDHSGAAQWFEGFRFQNVINSKITNILMKYEYNKKTNTFEPKEDRLIKTIYANQILKNPWDYDYIEKTVLDLDIKYIYISERKDLFHASQIVKDKPFIYPDSKNWAWKDYSGNSRIAMYEQNPKLELILRYGDSALFRVI